MKREAQNHPKMLDLAARLNVNVAQAIGHVTLLITWTADHAIQGDVGKWPDGAIARGAGWDGDPTVFVTALVESGWLDQIPDHRLILHDWPEHAERWVKAKLAKLGKDFLDCYSAGADSVATTTPTVERTTVATPPRDRTEPNRTETNRTEPVSPSLDSDDVLSVTVDEFVATWNASPGIIRIRDMSAKRSKQLRARLSQPGWEWRTALAKFPLKCFANQPNGWKPDIEWFLRPDSVTNILEGKYDWTKGSKANGPGIGAGQTFDPTAEGDPTNGIM